MILWLVKVSPTLKNRVRYCNHIWSFAHKGSLHKKGSSLAWEKLFLLSNETEEILRWGVSNLWGIKSLTLFCALRATLLHCQIVLITATFAVNFNYYIDLETVLTDACKWGSYTSYRNTRIEKHNVRLGFFFFKLIARKSEIVSKRSSPLGPF